jgi:hypothetical protein
VLIRHGYVIVCFDIDMCDRFQMFGILENQPTAFPVKDSKEKLSNVRISFIECFRQKVYYIIVLIQIYFISFIYFFHS